MAANWRNEPTYNSRYNPEQKRTNSKDLSEHVKIIFVVCKSLNKCKRLTDSLGTFYVMMLTKQKSNTLTGHEWTKDSKR